MEEPNGDTSQRQGSLEQEQERSSDVNWTVLNVDFGIPLFDSLLNQQVCDRIISQRVWQKETLDALKATQCTVTHQLMEFISAHVDPSTDEPGAVKEVALPTKNLLFCDATLRLWDGK